MIQIAKEYMEGLIILFKTSIAFAFYWSFDAMYLFLVQLSPDKSKFHDWMMNAKDIIGIIFSIVLLLIAVLKLIKQYKNRNT